MTKKLLVALAMMGIIAAFAFGAPGGVSAAAAVKPPDTFTLHWRDASYVYIGGVRYGATLSLWRNNQTGCWHGHVSGYPAASVGIYNVHGNLIAGNGKYVGWGEANTADVCHAHIQAGGLAQLPADNGVKGNWVQSGITT